MQKIAIFFLCLPIVAFGQEKGVRFEHGLSWEKIVKKAKAENKRILVDCYATWCAPCKYMNDKVFPLDTVGKVINGKYICVELQMDSTKTDKEEVRNWHATARSFEKKFNIDAFPTFLFFSPDGEILHKTVGAKENAKDFLTMVKNAEDPAKQYYTLINHYREHQGDSAFLASAIYTVLVMGDRTNASLISDVYLDCIKNPYQKNNLQLIGGALANSTSKGFKLIFEHRTEVDTALCINAAEKLLTPMVMLEDIDPLTSKGAPPVNWDAVYKKLSIKYFPSLAERVVLMVKLPYYGNRKMWKEYGAAVVDYMRRYMPELDASQINNNAWNVFLFCDDPGVIREALIWSQHVIDPEKKNHPDPYYIDTYASLLYKTGNKADAMIWEQKALSLSLDRKDAYESEACVNNIKKMMNGEKTWGPPM